MYLRLKILLILILVPHLVCRSQEIYKSTEVEAAFFSSAPIEDIQAKADDGVSIWNTMTGEVRFRINIRSFEFAKAKMQEHFNENFMESDKYPYATFKAEVQDEIDFTKNAEYRIEIVGVLEIHGVQQKRSIPAILRISDDALELKSEFKVALEDHYIKIPKILWKNIAEIVKVEVKANYSRL